MEITKKAINRFSTIYRPFGALEGTRIPGPLIKRASRRDALIFISFEFTSFLRKVSLVSA